MFDSAAALVLDHRVRRAAVPAVVAACVIGVVLATLTGRQGDPAEALARARDLMVEHRPEAALKETRRALALLGRDGDPDLHAKALARAAQIADLHMPDAHLPEAIGYYRELIRSHPESDAAFEAGLRLAELLRQRLHDDLHAEEQFVQVVDAFPHQAGVERLLLRAGRIALDNRRHPNARAYATRLLERYPESDHAPEAQALVGQAYRLEGLQKEAAQALLAVADRWPGTEASARALALAGDCLADQGDFGHAIARYIESLPRHPDPMQVQRSLDRARRHFSAQRNLEAGVRSFAFSGGY
jgi:TolA-binding protein